jgi:hypothetical protein
MKKTSCCSPTTLRSTLGGARVWFVVIVFAALGAVAAMTPRSMSAQAVPVAHDRLHHYLMSPTFAAAQSGAWSEPGTWRDGAVPGDRARVAIPAGITVTVDREIPARLDWVNVEGVLRFEPKAVTALTAHTVVVMESGQLEVGTVAQPVTGRTILTLASQGREFDHALDPLELTLGLIAMGQVRIHGQSKTAWVPISTAPAAGATRIRPDRLPDGWQPGDRLILTASTYGQEEELTFERIDGAEIVFAEPLKYARVFPEDGLSVHVGNLSRNVVIRSDPADAGNVRRQAHVMLMSQPHPKDIRYAEFRDLGRTTIDPVTDPRILPDGTRDPSLCPSVIDTENIRARYALHFHHVGDRIAPVQHYLQGVSIHVKKRARLKVGLINHSSNVVVEDSVGYNIDGSTFMTEEGNEIGAFRRNLAVSSFGSNLKNEDQPREIHMRNTCPDLAGRRRVDMAHNGSGFWIHSAGVETIGNVAAGHTNAGFDFWTQPLDKPNSPPHLRFEAKYLRRGGAGWPFGGGTVELNRVPGLFQNNVAYAAGFQRYGRKAGFALSHGMQAWKSPGLGKTLVDGFVAWNVTIGVDSEYTGSTIWRNLRIIAGNRAPGDVGVNLRRQSEESNNEVHSARVSGFTKCVLVGNNGKTTDIVCDSHTASTPSDPSAPPASNGGPVGR